MAIITQNINKDYLAAYDGYNSQQVGMGLIDPNIYASDEYRGRKISTIALGLISEVRYSGYETDPNPNILTMAYEMPYNTILAYNLNYGTPQIRRALLKYVLDSNAARIKSNQPIMVDYYGLKRLIPDSQYLVRRYKVVGLSPVETYPLTEWANVAKKSTKFDGYFLRYKSGR